MADIILLLAKSTSEDLMTKISIFIYKEQYLNVH